jgi:hypothetical protein
MRFLRIVLLSLLAIGVEVAVVAPLVAADCGQVPVQIKPIGHPIWKPVDFHVFSTAIGTADDGYAEFSQTLTNLLYPLRHQSCASLGIGPGDPHVGADPNHPTYVHEMEAGMNVMNYADSNVFRAAQFSGDQGVFAVWMVVPNPGTTGSSPDFAAGPIIPNSLFPIHIYGVTYRNNQVWNSGVASFDVPPLNDQLSCPFLVDGHSHFPIFIADSSVFVVGGLPTGHFEYRVKMTDTTGNGWFITIGFTVQQ